VGRLPAPKSKAELNLAIAPAITAESGGETVLGWAYRVQSGWLKVTAGVDAESREATESVSVDRVRLSLSSYQAVRVASGEDVALGAAAA
jgi:hypothetical protein